METQCFVESNEFFKSFMFYATMFECAFSNIEIILERISAQQRIIVWSLVF